MNTKRQRRPNVRLGEIGDVSAAFACGYSQGTKEKLSHRRWRNDFVNPIEIEQNNPVCGFSEKRDSELTVSDPGVSPRNSDDSQQNRENKNPNSSRAFAFTASDETDKTKSTLDFGNITRKCRVMKRRGQSRKGNDGVFGSAWGSKLSPEFSGLDGKEYGEKEFGGYTFDIGDDYYQGNAFKDFSDCEMPATSKEACEYDMYESNNDSKRHENFGDYWSEDACFDGNDATKSGAGVWDKMKFNEVETNSVRTWLEEMGFGKYADVFEMHEVDEEALLLLTLEDLKEMGVFAVGPRRKLYNAIQQLRGGDVSG
ncbi:Mitogen-activated protein kinase kinase kinase [Parasponia andersonii]|uniref:Mitogen-activated protein kinase kinase kinase n=1 Tax=Parasponia andersonii TaxID=3476 RepID=A0A2P5BC98_PARAD|nr:Mitogen-activated protein kinase kinase kinase [Parasponia andersonii]